MLILGTGNDDKGTQLEQLVKDILISLGYPKIVTNMIRSGGEELDLSGDFPIPRLGAGPGGEPMIGECKAYKNSINLPVLHNFLGKIYLEEKRTKGNVRGILIALNGANGPCLGAYRDLQRDAPHIQLVTQDELLPYLIEKHAVCKERDLSVSVSRLTRRIVTLMELAYYDRKVYWHVRFDDGAFTVLLGNGELLPREKSAPIVEMIRRVEADGEFIDLAEEEKARVQHFLSRSTLIEMLLVSGGRCGLKDFTEKSRIEASFAEAIVAELEKHSLVIRQGDEILLPALSARQRVVLLRLMLLGSISSDTLDCDAYRALFDDELVSAILAYHGGVTMTESQRDELRKILEISPSAILSVAQPIPKIDNHRGPTETITDIINDLDVAVLMELCVDALAKDFQLEPLRKHFYETRGVVEYERKIEVSLKTFSGPYLRLNLRPRLALGQLDHSMTNGRDIFVIAQSHPDMPEPWEEIPEALRKELENDGKSPAEEP